MLCELFEVDGLGNEEEEERGGEERKERRDLG